MHPVHEQRPNNDTGWPAQTKWRKLRDEVGGRLIPVNSPLDELVSAGTISSREALFRNLKNPYYIRDHPGLTQTLGWTDAWISRPSAYCIEAREVGDIVAGINFARENNLRLVVKGGGHSYQGTSNATDSLLIWTRRLNNITIQTRFRPHGSSGEIDPQLAVTLGAGTIWMEAYEEITTRAGLYVQGGGCTTVGVAGLVLSGGFGSFSKHYGLVAASLLEAEVVTADGEIRIANPYSNPDLFWALKGGGGGSFGIVSKLTLRLHELPEYFGDVILTIKAKSDDAFRRLLVEFVKFYRENLFNDRWGEQIGVRPDNSLSVTMVSVGLDSEQSRNVWQPFLNWISSARGSYSLQGQPIFESIPARHCWDVVWKKKNQSRQEFAFDPRSDASPTNVWWQGDGDQAGWFIDGYESLWLPASLLETRSQERLADALFSSSRHWKVGLHFNKGLAGASSTVVKSAQDTAVNPDALTAFALAIVAGEQKPSYPGIKGFEPNLVQSREKKRRIEKCMNELRRVAPNGGSYVSESNYFEKQWQQSYWGSNYSSLILIKEKYDPTNLFVVHNGVGSEKWRRTISRSSERPVMRTCELEEQT